MHRHGIPVFRHFRMVGKHRSAARAVDMIAPVFQKGIDVGIRIPDELGIQIIGKAVILRHVVSALLPFRETDRHFRFDVGQFHVAVDLRLIRQHVPERQIHGIGIRVEDVEMISVNSHGRLFRPASQLVHRFLIDLAGRIVELVDVAAVVLAVSHIFHALHLAGGDVAVFLIGHSREQDIRINLADRFRQLVVIQEPAGGSIGLLCAFRAFAAVHHVRREHVDNDFRLPEAFFQAFQPLETAVQHIFCKSGIRPAAGNSALPAFAFDHGEIFRMRRKHLFVNPNVMVAAAVQVKPALFAEGKVLVAHVDEIPRHPGFGRHMRPHAADAHVAEAELRLVIEFQDGQFVFRFFRDEFPLFARPEPADAKLVLQERVDRIQGAPGIAASQIQPAVQRVNGKLLQFAILQLESSGFRLDVGRGRGSSDHNRVFPETAPFPDGKFHSGNLFQRRLQLLRGITLRFRGFRGNADRPVGRSVPEQEVPGRRAERQRTAQCNCKPFLHFQLLLFILLFFLIFPSNASADRFPGFRAEGGSDQRQSQAGLRMPVRKKQIGNSVVAISIRIIKGDLPRMPPGYACRG